MKEHEAESGSRCAWCDRALPNPADAMAVVHGPDSTILLTCDVPCLAELVVMLAGGANVGSRQRD